MAVASRMATTRGRPTPLGHAPALQRLVLNQQAALVERPALGRHLSTLLDRHRAATLRRH